MIMRLTDSIIIPLNTTQYAFELDDYADQVEKLAADVLEIDISSDLALLRLQIKHLQSASLALDEERVAAEENFRKALDRLPKFPKPHSRIHQCGEGFVRRLSAWYRSIFASSATDSPYSHITDWKDFLSFNLEEEKEFDQLSHLPFPKNPWFEFLKAAKRLVRVNKKILTFERGFLHPDGIKDREWYRHLGVAPGKWLGYGATTFPALTEAIVFDKDETLAREEVLRLIQVLAALTKQTQP
ncbi:hypothetical protein L218DRAFT_170058 [Marasmius fiardii PR-910]|nr:hypothetical protein L218DRAFT_170058 [Marasmius fiardii PR-910]